MFIKKSLIVIFSLAVFCSLSAAQDTVWTKFYGERGDNGGSYCQQTADGCFIIMGGHKPYPSPYVNIDNFWLIKTDPRGDTLWTRSYGVDSLYEVCKTGAQTSDGGYVMAGWVCAPGLIYDAIVVRTDSLGDTLWLRYYGGDDTDQIRCIIETADGGFIGVGSTYSYGHGYEDLYVIGIDPDGNMRWQHAFGGASIDWSLSICETHDGNYMLAGGSSSFGAGAYDVYLVKISPDGDSLWAKHYPVGDEYSDEVAIDMDKTSDGGYIIVGYSGLFAASDYDIHLQKIDGNGEMLWAKTYGYRNWDLAESIIETADGGFLIAAGTRSLSSHNDMNNWLLKTDASGDTAWTRLLAFSPSATGDDMPVHISRTDDGDYIVSGLVFNGFPNTNDVLFYKFHFDQTGIPEVENLLPIDSDYIGVSYPNPFNSSTTIEFATPSPMPVKAEIYDINGRYINTLIDAFLTGGEHTLNWNGDDFKGSRAASGVYFFKLTAGEKMETEKITLIK